MHTIMAGLLKKIVVATLIFTLLSAKFKAGQGQKCGSRNCSCDVTPVAAAAVFGPAHGYMNLADTYAEDLYYGVWTFASAVCIGGICVCNHYASTDRPSYGNGSLTMHDYQSVFIRISCPQQRFVLKLDMTLKQIGAQSVDVFYVPQFGYIQPNASEKFVVYKTRNSSSSPAFIMSIWCMETTPTN